MLNELKKYDNLGTPGYFWEFMHLLNNADSWTEKSIKEYFFNKIIDGRSIFDGCIPLLNLAKIISIDEETKQVSANYKYRNILYSEKLCQQKLLEGFLEALQKDEEFHKIFKNSHFDYLLHKAIVVNSSSFGFQYTSIRKLLIDFEFLLPHPDMQNKYIINSKWKKFLDVYITPKVRKLLGIEELKKKLAQQELNGVEAEKFVLAFEKRRLSNKAGIEWIAPYDSSAGFDILSFHNEKEEKNRFIEVKSYAGDTPYFYWTKNEIKIAQEMNNDYCIYLVNRNDMLKEDYEPQIIMHPSESVLRNNDWHKEIDKYYITKKKI